MIGIVENFNAASADEQIDKVSLFCSYASGKATEDSDVDLLVELNSTFVTFLSLGRPLTEFEEALAVSVDVVPAPLPDNSIISIEAMVPLFKRIHKGDTHEEKDCRQRQPEVRLEHYARFL